MARTDAIVLGAGIVGTSVALQLARRSRSVALIDRRGVGQETSYGNSGVIGGPGVFPSAFPRDAGSLLRAALKLAPQVNYHVSFLPRAAPWLLAFRAASTSERLQENARTMRPIMARALAEHETLLREAGAERYLRRNGWISIYRSERAFAALKRELAVCAELGVEARILDAEGASVLEPSLHRAFTRAIHWPNVATLPDPLAVTRAYAARLAALGGIALKGDARSLHYTAGYWRVDTAEGPVDSPQVVVALGPWAGDLLEPLAVRLPLLFKRGYHRHFRPLGNASLTRPVVDTCNGFVLAPMDQGIRLTTGAEFAHRDAAASPVQLSRVIPLAQQLFPLGEPAEATVWMGSRPCFADSRPVIGRARGRPGLWLAVGHGHFGLTLAPVTGRLLAEMMTGEVPFTDPAPFSAERFA